MLFASSLQKQRVLDGKGIRIGKIQDLIINLGAKSPYVAAVVIKNKQQKQGVYVPWEKIQTFEESEVTLKGSLPKVKPFEPRADEVLLLKDILDKQIVDTKGKKLVRVQDVKLARIGTKIRVVAVDVSASSMLRRLGFWRIANWLEHREAPHFINWEDVDILSRADPSIHLKVSHDKLSLLHPADIADVVDKLSPKQRAAVLQSLDMEIAAETMEEMDPAYQAKALIDMDIEKASHILEEMSPDDAADLLADLPEEKAEELLKIMDKEEAKELRGLLKHPENSAGGIMTTEYITITEKLNAKQAIASLRKQAKEVEEIYYLYIVDPQKRLVGVLSLKQIIMARPTQKIENIMMRDPVSVHLSTEQEEVARLVAKYNILALPVVNKQGQIKGIVTVDDAIDVVIPTAWKRRFPRVFA